MVYYKQRLFALKLLRKLQLGPSDSYIEKRYTTKTKEIEFHPCVDIKSFDSYVISKSTIFESYRHIKNKEFKFFSDSWFYVGTSKDTYDSENIFTNHIRWSEDVQTGFEYPLSRSDEIDYGNLPEGVDIKNVWELSRLQHLPRLGVLAYKCKEIRASAIREYKEQLTDFMKQNPVGFGVNYACPMDVGIRIVNILSAHDFMLQLDDSGILDFEFCQELYEFVYNSSRYIFDHLEIDLRSGNNGNHYLANLCGIIFSATYLNTSESKHWIEFASKELFSEARKQFLGDGSGFEYSTAYFRLSIELLIASVLLLYRQNVVVPEDVISLLSKAYSFANLIVKNYGDIIQVGDNDSGRLVILSDAYIDNTLMGNFMMDEFRALFGVETKNVRTNENFTAEYFWIKGLIANNSLFRLVPYSYDISSKTDEDIENDCEFKYNHKTVICFSNSIDLSDCREPIKGHYSQLDNLSMFYAEEFGLIKVVSGQYEVYIRTVGKQNRGLCAHIHDDITHFEVVYKGKTYFGDQGSYVYTSDKKNRELFRADVMHNVPVFKEKNVDFYQCFKAEKKYTGQTMVTRDNTIVIEVDSGNKKHIRKFQFFTEHIEVLDYSNEPFEYHCHEPQFFSKGYGMKKIQDGTGDILVKEF